VTVGQLAGILLAWSMLNLALLVSPSICISSFQYQAEHLKLAKSKNPHFFIV